MHTSDLVTNPFNKHDWNVSNLVQILASVYMMTNPTTCLHLEGEKIIQKTISLFHRQPPPRATTTTTSTKTTLIG
jgi:hypothetical protein